MSAPGFWDDQEKAQATVMERKSLDAIVKPLNETLLSCNDLTAMLEMAEEDESFAAEVPGEVTRLEGIIEDLKLKALLSGTHDAAGAIMTINARDGGTDANDWAEMLLRMYTQWASKNGYSVELVDRQDNEEAGINNATITIRGPMAYGYLRGETGMHRLVRISPFNSEGKRQTSFAAVDVSPEISDSVEIEIDPEDVREDTFRASGAGGQCDSFDAHSDEHRRSMPERTEPTQEPSDRVENVAGANGTDRRRKTRSRRSGQISATGQDGLWLADSQLLPPPRSTSERRSHKVPNGELSRGARRRYPRLFGLGPPLACRPAG
jgi:hypothetical protein